MSWRKAQIFILTFFGTISLMIFWVGVVTGGTFLSSFFKKAHLWALFPAPVVFTNVSYLFQRDVTLTLSSGEQIQLDQAEMIARSYSVRHHLVGVAVWHFLKSSPSWSDAEIRLGLQSYFCDHASLFEVMTPVASVEYRIHAQSQSERKITHLCERR